MFENAPFDNDGFTLIDRWYCEETSIWYPVGTSRREIERDLIGDKDMCVVVYADDGDFAAASTAKLFTNYEQAYKYMKRQVINTVINDCNVKRSDIVLKEVECRHSSVNVCDTNGILYAEIDHSFAYIDVGFSEWKIFKVC